MRIENIAAMQTRINQWHSEKDSSDSEKLSLPHVEVRSKSPQIGSEVLAKTLKLFNRRVKNLLKTKLNAAKQGYFMFNPENAMKVQTQHKMLHSRMKSVDDWSKFVVCDQNNTNQFHKIAKNCKVREAELSRTDKKTKRTCDYSSVDQSQLYIKLKMRWYSPKPQNHDSLLRNNNQGAKLSSVINPRQRQCFSPTNKTNIIESFQNSWMAVNKEAHQNMKKFLNDANQNIVKIFKMGTLSRPQKKEGSVRFILKSRINC